jgi:hypothetical protein
MNIKFLELLILLKTKHELQAIRGITADESTFDSASYIEGRIQAYKQVLTWIRTDVSEIQEQFPTEQPQNKN